MNQTQEYLIQSLELHLFFARIMKEHSLFLKAGFLPPNQDLAREAESFLRQFEELLSRAIALSDGIVRRRVLRSGEVVTELTAPAEQQTQQLTGICIDQSLTARARRLRGIGPQAEPDGCPALVAQVRQLNCSALRLLDGLIAFKERVINLVGSCRIATGNYPLLLDHILREARMYRSELAMLEGYGEDSRPELRSREQFWDRIMMEHALFIRGLMDPTEEALISAANQFASDYKCLLDASPSGAEETVPGCGTSTLRLTQKFRDFKQAGAEGIENCKIRSLILPLLADHVLREANHYIRILGEPM